MIITGEKGSTFENSLHKEYITDLNDSNFSYKPKDQSILSVPFPASVQEELLRQRGDLPTQRLRSQHSMGSFM